MAISVPLIKARISANKEASIVSLGHQSSQYEILASFILIEKDRLISLFR
jgi:hypothetical protein